MRLEPLIAEKSTMKGSEKSRQTLLDEQVQINRLFEMIYLLLNKKSMTASEFAERFEVSPRTVYRDAELLSSVGIPIYMTKGKGGGISLLPDYVLNKTVLTDHEKTDILSALNAVDAVSLDQTNTAMDKLSSLFGNVNADWLEVDFSSWANPEEEATVFNALKTAIIHKKSVEFLYHSGDGSVKRTAEPLKLCFKGQAWYLYAYCKLREDYRFFKLRRIKDLTLSGEPFDRLTPSKIFSEEKKFQDEYVNVTMKLSKEMAYRIFDEFSQYEMLADGSFIVQIKLPKGEWIYHYISTYGENCEVLAPEEIRLETKKKLQKTLSHYEK